MSQWQKEVLNAEVAIRRLAEELALEKGIVERVKIVEQQLEEAASALEKSREGMERVMASFQATVADVQTNFTPKVTGAISEFGERVRQTLEQGYRELSATVNEARTVIANAVNALMGLREGFERDVSTLKQQNDQLLQRLLQQGEETKRLSRLLWVCLALSGLANIVAIVIIVLLLRK